MAIPTNPTDTSIVTMAYKDFGVSQPSSAQISRAISDGIEWVKRDLCNLGHEWKFMHKVFNTTLPQGRSSINAPSNYIKFIGARIMEGSFSGTLTNTASSQTQCTLQNTYTPGTSATIGKTILFLSFPGATVTGQDQARIINGYTPSTFIATFDVALDTAVNNNNQYLIVDTFTSLDPTSNITALQGWTIPSLSLKPTLIIEDPNAYANNAQGVFRFNYTADKNYGIELRYYGDLLAEDTASNTYSYFLKVACSVVTQGVFYWLLQDDTRRREEFLVYEKMKRAFANRWLYGYDMSHLQMTTGEE